MAELGFRKVSPHPTPRGRYEGRESLYVSAKQGRDHTLQGLRAEKGAVVSKQAHSGARHAGKQLFIQLL